MAGFKLRSYQAEDEETVKEIFTLGFSELIPSLFVHTLKQPLTQMVLTCVFCALLASSKSFLLPVLAVTLLLAAMRQFVIFMMHDYIETSIREDVGHVQETYMEKDSCFWVAESEGLVVGMVACQPAKEHPEYIELKRMSVKRSHRRMGVAKALCGIVVKFSCDRGYKAVILQTSVIQTDAQKLYESMDFRKIRQFLPPDLLLKIMNFTILEYLMEVQNE